MRVRQLRRLVIPCNYEDLELPLFPNSVLDYTFGMSRLGVNIDHVATLKRLRDTPYPNILQAAEACIAGGADQITVHLREDRRHIVDHDVRALKGAINVDLNFEMAATEEMLQFALKLKPHSICVVPEKREERTTEGGLDFSNTARNEVFKRIAHEANAAGILVSFFIEPSAKDIEISHALGAKAVELHTGSLCIAEQTRSPEIDQHWNRLRDAIEVSKRMGLFVHAGHGIDYEIAAKMKNLDIIEYNIGHALVCEAVFVGLKNAVARMKEILNAHR